MSFKKISDKSGLDINCCIDWVSITFPMVFNPDSITFKPVFDSMKIKIDEYTEMGYGLNRYKVGFIYGENIRVFTKGNKNVLGQETTQLLLSGDACREIEYFGADWLEFFEACLSLGGTCRRLDTPADEMGGLFTVSELFWKIQNKEFTSRLKSHHNTVNDPAILKQILKTSKNDGFTYDLGGKQTKHLTIYNKAAERASKNYLLNVDNWIRFEAKWYGDMAHVVFLKVVQSLKDGNFNELVASLIGGLIRFVQNIKYDENNRYKEDTWDKWDFFLQGVASFTPVIQEKKEKTLVKQARWVKIAAAPSLARILLKNPDTFNKYETEMMERSLNDFSYKDLAIVNKARVAEQLKPLTKPEAEKILSDYINGVSLNRITGEIE